LQVAKCHQAKKKKVLKHSEDALCVVLAEVSRVFIRSVNVTAAAAAAGAAGAEGGAGGGAGSADADLASAGSKARALLEELCASFVREISDPKAHFLEVKPAVRGLAAMAPSIAYLAGGKAGGTTATPSSSSSSSVRSSGSRGSNSSSNGSGGPGLVMKVVSALKRAAEHDVQESACVRTSETGVLSLGVNAMHHAAVYLHALACVLHASPPAGAAASVGPELLQYLTRTSVDLVVVFPRMKLLHQPVVSQALCLLLLVYRTHRLRSTP